MKSKKKLEMLNNIDPAYVEEADVTAAAPAAVPGKKKKGESGFARFMSSPAAAAVISGVIAIGVVIFIIRAGRTPGGQPAGSVHEGTGSASASERVNELNNGTGDSVFTQPTEVPTEAATGVPTEDEDKTECGTEPPTEAATRPPVVPLPEYDLLTVDPSFATMKQNEVRILVMTECEPDINTGCFASGAVRSESLDEAVYARDAALREVWGCEPTYTLAADAVTKYKNCLLAGMDEFEICDFTLNTAIQNVSNCFMSDLTCIGLGLGTDVWDAGMTALTVNGRNVFASPAVSMATGNHTYGVIYDPKADGGYLQSRLSSVEDWTWADMYAMQSDAGRLTSADNVVPPHGTNWGKYAFPALLIGGGQRMVDLYAEGTYTYWPADGVKSVSLNDYWEVLTLDAAQDGVEVFTDAQNPFSRVNNNSVFTVGPLVWLKEPQGMTRGAGLMLLPIPRRNADQSKLYTSAYGGSCMFIPTMKNNDSYAMSSAAAALYVYADVTNKQLRTPYLDWLTSDADSASRRNAERLLESRVYDFILNNESGYVFNSVPGQKDLTKYVKTVEKTFTKLIQRWGEYYPAA